MVQFMFSTPTMVNMATRALRLIAEDLNQNKYRLNYNYTSNLIYYSLQNLSDKRAV